MWTHTLEYGTVLSVHLCVSGELFFVSCPQIILNSIILLLLSSAMPVMVRALGELM